MRHVFLCTIDSRQGARCNAAYDGAIPRERTGNTCVRLLQGTQLSGWSDRDRDRERKQQSTICEWIHPLQRAGRAHGLIDTLHFQLSLSRRKSVRDVALTLYLYHSTRENGTRQSTTIIAHLIFGAVPTKKKRTSAGTSIIHVLFAIDYNRKRHSSSTINSTPGTWSNTD